MRKDGLNIEGVVRALMSGDIEFRETTSLEQERSPNGEAANDKANRKLFVAHRIKSAKSLVASLSLIEQEILRQLVEGFSNSDIAERIGLCAQSVEIERAELFRKLGVTSTTEAVRIGIYAEVALDR